MSAPRLMPQDYRIEADDLTGKEVTGLLQQHLADMARWSPQDKVHAMPAHRLRQPDVRFFSAWHDGAIAAVGAIRQLDAGRAELKAMRAADGFLRRGAGEAILLHLISVARASGYKWLGLETGNTAPFLPARSLYAKHGFTPCLPFAGYVDDGFSLCMARDLE